MALEKITDVTVTINIQNPQPIVGLGNPAIFVKGTAAAYVEYESIETLKKSYDDTTAVFKKVNTIWNQNNKPRTVAVVTFEEGKIKEAAENYFFESWHFALLAEFEAADALALSNVIEEQKFKFLVVQVANVSDLVQFDGNSLTIGIVHTLDEPVDAALVGNTASLQVGSVTWKGRPNLVGIKENKLTVSELNAIHEAGGIAYVKKAGIPQTSEGKTVGGEFIDALHGDHWVKSNIESKIQRLLSTTDKLTFDANGIALLHSTVSNIMQTAFTNGIIDMIDDTGAGNYAVSALQRSDLDPEDIARRNYKGLSFEYKRSGAIHTVDVTGKIEV